MSGSLNPQRLHAECLDDRVADVLRAKTPRERLAIADGMWRSARSMIECMVRQAHPDWTPAQVSHETARRLSHGAL